jgi:hypothetical protein
LSAARNCTRDEGGPFEFGDQEPISSHRKLLRANAVVVSVAEIYFEPSCFAFACRLCHGLGYKSQLESQKDRAITKARKLRMRLGGGPNLLDPLPERPPRMHPRTFHKLFNEAADAQERYLALALEHLRRRDPEHRWDSG